MITTEKIFELIDAEEKALKHIIDEMGLTPVFSYYANATDIKNAILTTLNEDVRKKWELYRKIEKRAIETINKHILEYTFELITSYYKVGYNIGFWKYDGKVGEEFQISDLSDSAITTLPSVSYLFDMIEFDYKENIGIRDYIRAIVQRMNNKITQKPFWSRIHSGIFDQNTKIVFDYSLPEHQFPSITNFKITDTFTKNDPLEMIGLINSESKYSGSFNPMYFQESGLKKMLKSSKNNYDDFEPEKAAKFYTLSIIEQIALRKLIESTDNDEPNDDEVNIKQFKSSIDIAVTAQFAKSIDFYDYKIGIKPDSENKPTISIEKYMK